MNILVLGKSDKFILVVKNIWAQHRVTILPWRSIQNIDWVVEQYEIILVCGYDYSSYNKSVKEYIDSNVVHPFNFIKDLASKNVDIIYIMTDLPRGKYTFSRYMYAKYLLAYKMFTSKLNVFILPIPTVVDANGNADGYRPSSAFMVNILKKIKLLRSIEIVELTSYIGNYKANRILSLPLCKPLGLTVPRNISIDRVLRLILG